MSEVDRLSTSGTYPALAIADRRRSRDEARDAAGHDGRKDDEPRKDAKTLSKDAPTGPRPPTSLIDEYA